jgi:hypothetical protein
VGRRCGKMKKNPIVLQPGDHTRMHNPQGEGGGGERGGSGSGPGRGGPWSQPLTGSQPLSDILHNSTPVDLAAAATPTSGRAWHNAGLRTSTFDGSTVTAAVIRRGAAPAGHSLLHTKRSRRCIICPREACACCRRRHRRQCVANPAPPRGSAGLLVRRCCCRWRHR